MNTEEDSKIIKVKKMAKCDGDQAVKDSDIKITELRWSP